MGFQANVLTVMIASPGDVAVEREIITTGLYQWNNANTVSRKLILQPIKWETHSSPQMGVHPQAIINERLLYDADIVVGIFGNPDDAIHLTQPGKSHLTESCPTHDPGPTRPKCDLR
jgi:hypothetical protein